MTPRLRTILSWLIPIGAILGLWMMASDVSVLTGVDLRLAVIPLAALYIYFWFVRKA